MSVKCNYSYILTIWKEAAALAEPIHDGHRKRMRERYLRAGIIAFDPHEMLEMLLYHAIPRADTNPVGHALLERFGSVRAVLAAPATALREVPGMTDNAVTMILFLRDLYEHAQSERMKGRVVDCYRRSKAIFEPLFAYEENEVLWCAFLDEEMRLIALEKLSVGGAITVDVPEKRIAARAFALHSRAIVLAHNHPHENAEPSDRDIAATKSLLLRLHSDGIALKDHIIVGEYDVVSLREQGRFLWLDL